MPFHDPIILIDPTSKKIKQNSITVLKENASKCSLEGKKRAYRKTATDLEFDLLLSGRVTYPTSR